MIIRFMADTWRDAVMRPLAMAAPNSWVYTEIFAPDFRFVFALGLAVAALIAMSIYKRPNADRWPVLILLGLTFLSFVPWMATSGNGRYFMPYLVLVGPLCIGLVNILSCTKGMKASIVLLVLGMQGFALFQNNPWKPFNSWGGTPWLDAPYFSIDVDPKAIDPNTTYITVTKLSMSLLAPQFPAASRWVNLSVFEGSDVSKPSRIYDPVVKILGVSTSLKLFQRSKPQWMQVGTDQPNQIALNAFNKDLQPHRLAIKVPTDCKLLASKSQGFSVLQVTSDNADEASRHTPGFWICALEYPVATALKAQLTEGSMKAAQVFEKMESLCPRFFPPGQTMVDTHPSGYSRAYPGSDTSLILKQDGDLYVKNELALDPEKIGQADEVLNKRQSMDCTKFRGRSGLPWEREI
jgi:hypothetical protein